MSYRLATGLPGCLACPRPPCPRLRPLARPWPPCLLSPPPHHHRIHTSPRRSLGGDSSGSGGGSSNHYETLGLPPTASQADVKKQYYTLSKSTHPDRNPDDPGAAARFSAVSDAYATLGNAEKRARYDRDVMRQHHHRGGGGGHSGPGRSGSYSSAQAGGSGPNGSRPASGLSKRRSPFRGPPPSFYRGGGYGAYGQRAAQEEANAANARRAAAGGQEYHDPEGWAKNNTTNDASSEGGFSPGQGAPRGFDNDVPHFDRAAHYRTQESVTGRTAGRKSRLYREHIDMKSTPGMGSGASFVVISLVVGMAIVVPVIVLGMSGEKKKRKGDG